MGVVVRGSLAGIVATGLMTLVIGAARTVGLLRTPPPAQIIANIGLRAATTPPRSEPEFGATWLAAHTGYGAGCGVVYGSIRPLLPRSTALAGLIYGEAVWVASYLGLMPALGLHPWSDEDSPARTATMIAAHAVFGIATAEAEHRLARPA